MKTKNNTILITGGSAGIGFEIAKLFSVDNLVIITGRNEQRLKDAVDRLNARGNVGQQSGSVKSGNVTGIVGDVSEAEDVDRLVKKIGAEYPDLNIVINNAGKASGVYNLADENANAYERASAEMLTNYLSIIRLNEKLLPLLRKQAEAAIVNVSSIVAIVPGTRLSTYGASKAALHSYSLSLRYALSKSTGIKVFELQPPLVDTEFSSEIDGKNGIPASVVAEDLKKGLAEDDFEIRVGRTADIYKLYLSSPEQAFLAMQPK